jgi:hypothetical protein
MKTEEIKALAKNLNIKIGKKKKGELIREIQTAEGNWPCFETANGYCDQLTCAWRKECVK